MLVRRSIIIRKRYIRLWMVKENYVRRGTCSWLSRGRRLLLLRAIHPFSSSLSEKILADANPQYCEISFLPYMTNTQSELQRGFNIINLWKLVKYAWRVFYTINVVDLRAGALKPAVSNLQSLSLSKSLLKWPGRSKVRKYRLRHLQVSDTVLTGFWVRTHQLFCECIIRQLECTWQCLFFAFQLSWRDATSKVRG